MASRQQTSILTALPLIHFHACDYSAESQASEDLHFREDDEVNRHFLEKGNLVQQVASLQQTSIVTA
ncbi:hypothetical protein [Vibrio barjaei]|uniref:hypothetical protein n=1 Tax=Vibrio barjaei TaxID=1676683 RepID=UPI0022846C04|nr:hypothetical protein [Vibrio barjaei]MCY9872775.1 hypothetical protein [Vibrio barjaei]